jgi:hypothetical protein
MRRLIVLIGIAALATSVGATTLNKCIDAQGKVTYSNLPCRNAQEARTVDIDPAPQADPVRSAQPARPVSAKQAASPSEPATIQLETRSTTGKTASRTSTRQCDAITDKLGHVFDKMDQARRKGYTQAQMDAWNQEVKELERKKQQSGCF